jgi:hypothetical protein
MFRTDDWRRLVTWNGVLRPEGARRSALAAARRTVRWCDCEGSSVRHRYACPSASHHSAAFIAGTVMSVATTTDPCVDEQWGSCAVGVASLGATGIGYKFGRIASKLSKTGLKLSGLKSLEYRAGGFAMRGFSQVYNGASVLYSGIGTIGGSRLNNFSKTACGN